MAEALAFLHATKLPSSDSHSAAVVHGDIRPENVVVDEVEGEYRYLLSEFGTAHLLEDRGGTELSSELMNPRYTAPELVEEVPILTSAVDVFGFAMTAYEVCALLFRQFDADRYTLQINTEKEPFFETRNVSLCIK